MSQPNGIEREKSLENGSKRTSRLRRSLRWAGTMFTGLAAMACAQTVEAPPSIPFVKVIYPNGGEIFTAGDRIRIAWEGNGSNTYSVDLHDPAGNSWQNIAFIRDPNIRFYDWRVNVYDIFSDKPIHMVVTGDSDSGSVNNIRVQDFSDGTIRNK